MLNVKIIMQELIIVSSDVVIPREIENFITLLDVPLPDDKEITACLDKFIDELKKQRN